MLTAKHQTDIIGSTDNNIVRLFGVQVEQMQHVEGVAAPGVATQLHGTLAVATCVTITNTLQFYYKVWPQHT